MAERNGTITESSMRRISRAVIAIERMPKPKATYERGPRGTPVAAIRMLVQSIENDYLVCRTWDGENLGEDDVYVAKPYELRHVLANYPQLDAFTTVDVGEATVTYDGTDYTWKATPDYVVDAEIEAARVAQTGVTVSGEDLTWIDANTAGRAWGIEE